MQKMSRRNFLDFSAKGTGLVIASSLFGPFIRTSKAANLIDGSIEGDMKDCYDGAAVPILDIRAETLDGSLVFPADYINGTQYHIPIDIPTGIGDENVHTVPKDFVLFQNYPNPFGNATMLNYVSNKPGRTEITIYDILGRKVKSMAVSDQFGYNEHLWKRDDDVGRRVANGVYFFVVESGKQAGGMKMSLVDGNSSPSSGQGAPSQQKIEQLVNQYSSANKVASDDVILKLIATGPDHYERINYVDFSNGGTVIHNDDMNRTGHIAWIDNNQSNPEVTGARLMDTLYRTCRRANGYDPYGGGLHKWKQQPIFYINTEGFTTEHGFPENAVELMKEDILYMVNTGTPFSLSLNDIQSGTANLMIPNGTGGERVQPGYAFSKFDDSVNYNSAWSYNYYNPNNTYELDGKLTEHGKLMDWAGVSAAEKFKWRNRHEIMRMLGFGGGPDSSIYNGHHSLLAQWDPDEPLLNRYTLSELDLALLRFVYPEQGSRYFGNFPPDQERLELFSSRNASSLAKLIKAGQVTTGMSVNNPLEADSTGDGKVGLDDMVHILQKEAGLR